MNEKMLNALSSAIYVSRLTLDGKQVETDDQKIRASGLYPDWVKGKHEKGEIYNANGQTWECCQAYDNQNYPDLTPDDPSWHTFNRPLHGKTKETARPWVKPQYGTVDLYLNGEYMIYTDGKIYRCIVASTNFSPEEQADAWEVQE